MPRRLNRDNSTLSSLGFSYAAVVWFFVCPPLPKVAHGLPLSGKDRSCSGNHRNAEKRDEIETPHCQYLPRFGNKTIAQHCCAAGFQSSRCRRWVKVNHSAMSAPASGLSESGRRSTLL